MLRGRLVWGRFVTWVDECCILPDRSPFKPLTLSLHQLSQFTTRMIVWKWGFKVSQRKKRYYSWPSPWTLKIARSILTRKNLGFLLFSGRKVEISQPGLSFYFAICANFATFFLLGAPKARANHFEMTFQKEWSAGPGPHRYAEPRSENFRPPI